MIVPAAIPQSVEDITSFLKTISTFARAAQIDVVDGAFVPFVSWPYKEGQWNELRTLATLDEYADIEFEIDLMVQDPEDQIEEWLRLPFARYIIHIESTEHARTLIDTVHKAGKKIELSFNNDTDLSMVEPYLDAVDFVQCMGIAEIGAQGQPFDPRVLDRIRTIKEKCPDLSISVDGSVNKDTIVQIKDAGADRFVSGSAIVAAADPEKAYHELEQLIR